MDLKELLGEELYNQLMAKLGDKKIAIVSDGNWIPKEKFDTTNEEKKQYKQQVESLNKQLGELQKTVKDNEEAANTIEALKKQITDKETELNNTRKLSAIKLEVLKANPNDVTDILPHLKQDAINIADDGKITGLEEQIKGLKESKPYLFKEVQPTGTGGSLGNGSKGKIPQPAASLKDALSQFYNKK
ncbi:MAG: phage scaffolding protein [Clostridiales bacterium]|nr:phage scaffolding protein [Clostridiales bacterium]